MKTLNSNQMTALNGGICDPQFLSVFVCVLRITGNHLTDVCHPEGEIFLGLICN
jgi:hypothetical protein